MLVGGRMERQPQAARTAPLATSHPPMACPTPHVILAPVEHSRRLQVSASAPNAAQAGTKTSLGKVGVKTAPLASYSSSQADQLVWPANPASSLRQTVFLAFHVTMEHIKAVWHKQCAKHAQREPSRSAWGTIRLAPNAVPVPTKPRKALPSATCAHQALHHHTLPPCPLPRALHVTLASTLQHLGLVRVVPVALGGTGPAAACQHV